MRNAFDQLEIQRRQVTAVTDGTPVYDWTTVSTQYGFVTLLSGKERTDWEGQAAEASARIPLPTDVSTQDRINVIRAVQTTMQGQWQIVGHLPNRDHLRLLLKRTG